MCTNNTSNHHHHHHHHHHHPSIYLYPPPSPSLLSLRVFCPIFSAENTLATFKQQRNAWQRCAEYMGMTTNAHVLWYTLSVFEYVPPPHPLQCRGKAEHTVYSPFGVAACYRQCIC